MSPPAVEFYFDFSCPYAYLASTQIRALCERHDAELIWRPFLLGGVFRHWARPQNMASGMSPAKARHNALDMQRWAAFYDVPLEMPGDHPIRTVEALRLLLVAPESAWSALIEDIYQAYWVEGRDVSDRGVLAEIASGRGLDGASLMARVDEAEIKQALRERTDEAIERGVFGAPTIFVGDEGWWGQDRLHFVEEAIAAPDTPRMMPPAVGPAEERGQKVRFYFDFSSPFAYLAATQVESVCARHGAELIWHPMLLGAVFKQVGTPNVPLQGMVAPKQRMQAQDMKRYAERYGVPFDFPSHFPVRSVLALRVALAQMAQGPLEVPRLVRRLFRAYWAEGRDIESEEVVAGLASELGLDGADLVARTRDPAIKRQLFETTSAAVEDGVFGAPSFRVEGREGVDGAIIWGQDRLDILGWTLARG